MIHLIACSHGTDNLTGRATVDALRAEIDRKLQEHIPDTWQVHEAYVDIQSPSLSDVLTGIPAGEQAIIVPLFLSAGYHTGPDMRTAMEQARHLKLLLAQPLGPDPSLAELQVRRLQEAGWSGERVMLAAAGSSRMEGQVAVARQASSLGDLIDQEVPHGFIASIEPTVSRVAVAREASYASSYLLAAGYFQSLLGQKAEGLTVTAPLLNPDDPLALSQVADLALERARTARPLGAS